MSPAAVVRKLTAPAMVRQLFTFLVLLAGSLVPKTEASPTSSLIFSSVLFRHGDRTPTMNYPNDPYDESYWPEGWGQLTTVGMGQAYHLGEVLRTLYGELLGPLYNLKDVSILSSDYDRCIMTAQTCLAGLYSPKGKQVWRPELLWQPIPLRSTPIDQDMKIAAGKSCPKYEEELDTVYATEGKRINEQNAELIKYISKYFGKNVTTFMDAALLYDTLLVERHHNLPLPAWTEPIFPEKLKAVAIDLFYLTAFTKTMQRLRSGVLVNDIIQNMLAKRDGTLSPNRKLQLYAGHDMTIVNLYQSLDFKERSLPGYADAVVLELHVSHKTKEYEVKLLHIEGTPVKTIYEQPIPGCGKPCLLDNFVNLMEPISLTESQWDEECTKDTDKQYFKIARGNEESIWSQFLRFI